jgi:hypothetical protein
MALNVMLTIGGAILDLLNTSITQIFAVFPRR